jgi:anti-anti-sigma regulatory factor
MGDLMKLFAILGHAKPASDRPPDFIRELQDIRGVRVIRLQGPVGKEIGAQANAADKSAAESEGVFLRPLLFDFKETTHWDFVTIAYMVRALRRRMAAHTQVGIINAPPQLVAELEMVKLDAMFHVFASEEQALAELAGLSQ